MVLTDIHGSLWRASKLSKEAESVSPDLVAICGDLTDFGRLEDAETILGFFKRLPTVYVPGNCDPVELLNTENLSGAINIHGRLYRCNSLTILGVGGSLRGPFRTPIEFTENQIQKIINSALEDFENRLLIVSHNPPWNTRVDLTSSGFHIGSRVLRRLVEERKPLAFLCGHVHEAMGTDRVGETLILNPGPARHGFYAILDLNNLMVEFNRI